MAGTDRGGGGRGERGLGMLLSWDVAATAGGGSVKGGRGVARPFGLQNVNNMALTADIAGLKASCWAALGHAGTKARWGRGQWQVASGKWRLLCCLFAFSAAF